MRAVLRMAEWQSEKTMSKVIVVRMEKQHILMHRQANSSQTFICMPRCTEVLEGSTQEADINRVPAAAAP